MTTVHIAAAVCCFYIHGAIIISVPY